MTPETFISYLLQGLFLPPGINLLLALTAWILWKSWHRTARILLFLSASILFVLSIPTVANSLIISLQKYPALTEKQVKMLNIENHEEPLAIVILGGGRREKAPEYGDVDTVNFYTLERIRYGAFLHHKTGLPVLLTGGKVMGAATSEAVLMNQVLSSEFKISAKWLETESNNTYENALFSEQLLRMNNTSRVVLVTHAWHMDRAKKVFEKSNLEVIPAPTVFNIESDRSKNGLTYLPSPHALALSQHALHEYIGSIWYEIKAP